MGSLGDTVVALPCFNYIRSRYPNAEIYVLTNHPVSLKAAPLLSVLGEDNQIVDGVISYPVGLRSINKLLGLRDALKLYNPDAFIYLMPKRSFIAAWRDWLFFKSCGIRNIIGFPYKHSCRINLYDSSTNSFEYEASRLKRCLLNFGDINLDSHDSWDLHLSQDEVVVGNSFVKPFSGNPFISINMGGKDPLKDWGGDNWIALIHKLNTEFPGYGLFAVGASVDFERAQMILDKWSGISLNSCGKLSPRQSASAMRESTLFIGHDSGPLHLATAVGVPSVGLFGGLNKPKTWHPYGKNVSVIHKANGMSLIGVDEVFSLVTNLLLTLDT